MKEINVFDYSDKIMEALGNGGLFLNSKLDEKINSMTIGWGSISIYWGKPIFIAPVRAFEIYPSHDRRKRRFLPLACL